MKSLREMVRKTRDDKRNSCFTVHWKGSYHCKLHIGKQPPTLDPENSGVYNFIHNVILVRNFGNKANNKVKHRGGLPGTIFHEWCHRMQFWWSEGWLASSAVEMSAEAFRVLKGWRSAESWERDQEFLTDWQDFFMSDPVFSLLF